MGQVIVVQFATADGVVGDPDGASGTATGGWSYRFGLEAIDGDPFGIGAVLDEGALLFGRATWEVFASRWPARSGGYADRINGARKVVASRSRPDVSAWPGTSVLDGDLVPGVRALASDTDVAVLGSTSVVRALAAAGAVDEYRLLVFPTVVGQGERLWPEDTAPTDLRLVAAEPVGPLALLRYAVDR